MRDNQEEMFPVVDEDGNMAAAAELSEEEAEAILEAVAE